MVHANDYIYRHINLGKTFQAKVKRWHEHTATYQELNDIIDRDELVFDPQLLEHIPESTGMLSRFNKLRMLDTVNFS